MPSVPDVPNPDERRRFAPRAADAMAEMFDRVVDRYELLNGLMTLGRDAVWRRELWRLVAEDARVVLDLCAGEGSSLVGLRRPGRLVVGYDISYAMLARARGDGRAGWAPRLVCGDAFRLPFRDGAVDCVTVMFGVRNLRPIGEALAEMQRVLRPGGQLLVLEATGPRPGPLAPFHRFHLRHVVPLLGRLSPDPSAYEYLARSIEDFGSGDAFDHALDDAGFDLRRRRRFMLGAAGLWSARVRTSIGVAPPGAVQAARLGELPRGEMPTRRDPRDAEWRIWQGTQLVISATLLTALLYATVRFRTAGLEHVLEPWQQRAMGVLLLLGVVAFAFRTVVLALRILSPHDRP